MRDLHHPSLNHFMEYKLVPIYIEFWLNSLFIAKINIMETTGSDYLLFEKPQSSKRTSYL